MRSQLGDNLEMGVAPGQQVWQCESRSQDNDSAGGEHMIGTTRGVAIATAVTCTGRAMFA